MGWKEMEIGMGTNTHTHTLYNIYTRMCAYTKLNDDILFLLDASLLLDSAHDFGSIHIFVVVCFNILAVWKPSKKHDTPTHTQWPFTDFKNVFAFQFVSTVGGFFSRRVQSSLLPL